jgi:hypothetical protein
LCRSAGVVSCAEWWRLIPRFDDKAWGSFADRAHSLVSSDGQDTYVVFFFGSGTSTGTLNKLAQNASYAAQWFNPRVGQYQKIGSFRQESSEWAIPPRPTAEDWVLPVKSAWAGRSISRHASSSSYSSGITTTEVSAMRLPRRRITFYQVNDAAHSPQVDTLPNRSTTFLRLP